MVNWQDLRGDCKAWLHIPASGACGQWMLMSGLNRNCCNFAPVYPGYACCSSEGWWGGLDRIYATDWTLHLLCWGNCNRIVVNFTLILKIFWQTCWITCVGFGIKIAMRCKICAAIKNLSLFLCPWVLSNELKKKIKNYGQPLAGAAHERFQACLITYSLFPEMSLKTCKWGEGEGQLTDWRD